MSTQPLAGPKNGQIAIAGFAYDQIVTAVIFLVALCFVLFVQGAMPFIAAPTLGQALWVAGFGHSFINDSLFSIHAHNFGWPAPAPIAFGLTGAYPTGLFIAAGLNPLDAYSAMAALWLAIAFYGAWRLSQLLGVGPRLAILTALFWMTMPAIWAHAGYSIVSIGMALMPFYFWIALRIIVHPPTGAVSTILLALAYAAVCIISAFTDGYSFIMFAVGAGIIFLTAFICSAPSRKYLFLFVFPVQAVSFGLGYLLYIAYFPNVADNLSSMDFFRGWGADVTFFTIPTQGILWILDALHLSVKRSNHLFFGDSSVWKTTFALPIMIVGLIGWWVSRRATWVATAFLLAGLFGFYMALGPSLKINSVKPIEMQQTKPGQASVLMPVDVAVAPTGSEILSANLPGFNSMRAAYRWSVLGFVCFWALAVLLMVHMNKRRMKIALSGLMVLLLLLNLPHLGRKWDNYRDNRAKFFKLENGIVSQLGRDLPPAEVVAFLPPRNDFLATYLAPRIGIRTFNTGGDKNLHAARLNWPATMRSVSLGAITPDFGLNVLHLLARKEADAVVLPYFDMLKSAHDGHLRQPFEDDLSPVIKELKETGLADVTERDFYAVVRLKPAVAQKDREVSEREVDRKYCKGIVCLKAERFDPGRTLTKVGVVQNGGILSSGKQGYLLFGPYLPLKAGDYVLRLKGTSVSGGSTWVDVVSQKGTKSHGRFALPQATGDGSAILVQAPIRIDDDANDVEVRVGVGEGDKVRLDSYELVPAPYRNSCNGAPCLKAGEFDPAQTLTQVGHFQDGAVLSSGKKGFLIFGPYLPMKAGDYMLTLKGTSASGGSAWADVVSGKSNPKVYGHFSLPETKGDGEAVLLHVPVHIDDNPSDVEIRVFVEPDDKVRLDGYELVPANEKNQ
ncbi:hypothetical protein DUT91_13670 [Phyllobacterium salinisoli]|uniref:Uncharacterized protein n=1 Tax=Phyllobacterium salinisoli TaxID=1899321 RepID=A0A368K3X8_9HYPH|nr:hypothetical protein [Phyllobacterium salinisoli]RCS23335.1 hypothetical protein DUT91_13670 [Phyllobacterium salinisoli]